MSRYRLLAAVVRAIHALLVLGGIALLAGMGLAAAVGASGWLTVLAGLSLGFSGVTLTAQLVFRNECPLTRLENSLRRRADPDFVPMVTFFGCCLKRVFGLQVSPRTADVINYVLLTLLFVIPVLIFLLV